MLAQGPCSTLEARFSKSMGKRKAINSTRFLYCASFVLNKGRVPVCKIMLDSVLAQSPAVLLDCFFLGLALAQSISLLTTHSNRPGGAGQVVVKWRPVAAGLKRNFSAWLLLARPVGRKSKISPEWTVVLFSLDTLVFLQMGMPMCVCVACTACNARTQCHAPARTQAHARVRARTQAHACSAPSPRVYACTRARACAPLNA